MTMEEQTAQRIAQALEGIEVALVALVGQQQPDVINEITMARRYVEHFRAVDRKSR